MAIVVRSARRASLCTHIDGGKGGGGVRAVLGCDPLGDEAAPMCPGGSLGGPNDVGGPAGSRVTKLTASECEVGSRHFTATGLAFGYGGGCPSGLARPIGIVVGGGLALAVKPAVAGSMPGTVLGMSGRETSG